MCVHPHGAKTVLMQILAVPDPVRSLAEVTAGHAHTGASSTTAWQGLTRCPRESVDRKLDRNASRERPITGEHVRARFGTARGSRRRCDLRLCATFAHV